jgi:hypothetical protein
MPIITLGVQVYTGGSRRWKVLILPWFLPAPERQRRGFRTKRWRELVTQQALDGDELEEGKSIRFTGWTTPPSMEIAYVTDVIANYTGREFLLAFARVVPPVFVRPSEIPDEMAGEILFRCVLTPERWVQAVDSFTDQIARMRERGTIPPRAPAGAPDTTSDEP